MKPSLQRQHPLINFSEKKRRQHNKNKPIKINTLHIKKPIETSETPLITPLIFSRQTIENIYLYRY